MYNVKKSEQSRQAAGDESVDCPINLQCMICQSDMIPPSTRESRRFVSLLCSSHIVHTACRALMRQTTCPVCKTQAESTEFSENASFILWNSGINARPKCGCGNTKHTREQAATCQMRPVTCMFPGCTDTYFLHEEGEHYDEMHANEEIAINPICPNPDCPEAHQLTLESFDAHVSKCEYRAVDCVCGFKGPVFLVRQHQMTCDKIKCNSRVILRQRIGMTLPGGKCHHGPGMACPFEVFLQAVRDLPPDRIDQILDELKESRELYVV